MTEAATALLEPPSPSPAPPTYRAAPVSRLLGRRIDDPNGPWLVCVAGIHGNEPAGIEALGRVFAALETSGERLSGALVAYAGNLGALAAGRRFLDRDLNRAWSESNLARIWAGGRKTREDQELAELEGELSSTIALARDRVVLLDLHTTSGAGAPFVVLDDSLKNRRFALAFPVPLVLGLEEELTGTMVAHWSARGVTCVAYEGGQHADPRSVDRCEAAIWIALAATGLLPRALKSRHEAAQQLLRSSRGEAPHLIEVLYRHRIRAEDSFRMRPGYSSFDPVAEGAELADDRHGAVRSPRTARILMPLYQAQGDDGFFLAVPVARFWFELSATLRRIRFDYLLAWLPGVRRHPTHPESFLVSRRIARFLVPEIFHLLGYKRLEAGPRHFVFTRRPEGF
jgi:predicted deacylase